ncbi:MAG: pyridoxal phosphate-dependent aminotransferase family protein [Victivallales bacterium]|nr:pyridoxal phosphate-dependent aminotransferase family protein [Victivallales bacterium]
MDILQKCIDFRKAEELRATGLYPYFHPIESNFGTEVAMEGQRRIMLGSNNYLGLTMCQEVIEAGIHALEKYGSGCSGSRLLNGTLDIHLQLEKELANFLGKEEALTFGTGYQTNLSIISSLVGRHDYVICDVENHASIYSACRLSFGKMLRYKHNDMEGLEACLQAIPKDSGALIVVDGLFSLGGDLANLPAIVRLAKQYGARTMVDDAHGLGVLGKGGRGSAFHFGLENEIDIFMGTFSKSLASLGGFVAASHSVIEYMRHTASPFVFSAAIPPANAAVALAALQHLEAHPELPDKLRQISEYARNAFAKRGLHIRESALAYPTPIIPLRTCTLENTFAAAQKLYDAGIYTAPFVPPATQEGDALIRTSYMAAHTEALIDKAADIMANVFAEMGLIEHGTAKLK